MKKVHRKVRIALVVGYLLAAGVLAAGVVFGSLSGGMPVGIELEKAGD